MAKSSNPNKSPDKGFLKELDKAPDLASVKMKSSGKPFTWDKPVSGGEARPNQMNVPRRLNEQTKVGRPKSSMVVEAKNFALTKKAKA
jgi:hypothetical protein